LPGLFLAAPRFGTRSARGLCSRLRPPPLDLDQDCATRAAPCCRGAGGQARLALARRRTSPIEPPLRGAQATKQSRATREALDCLASLAMTTMARAFVFPRRNRARAFRHFVPRKRRGRREDRVLAAPADGVTGLEPSKASRARYGAI